MTTEEFVLLMIILASLHTSFFALNDHLGILAQQPFQRNIRGELAVFHAKNERSLAKPLTLLDQAQQEVFLVSKLVSRSDAVKEVCGETSCQDFRSEEAHLSIVVSLIAVGPQEADRLCVD